MTTSFCLGELLISTSDSASSLANEGNDERLITTENYFRSGYASVNSSCAHPPPPGGQLRGICASCRSREWGIGKFGEAQGSGICLPRGHRRAFDAHVVSDSKPKHGGFYWKGPAVCHRLACLSRTGQTCGGFLDFMHLSIAYQGTT